MSWWEFKIYVTAGKENVAASRGVSAPTGLVYTL